MVASYVKLLENVLHFESGQCSAYRNGFCCNFSLSVLLSLSLTFSLNFLFSFFLLDQTKRSEGKLEATVYMLLLAGNLMAIVFYEITALTPFPTVNSRRAFATMTHSDDGGINLCHLRGSCSHVMEVFKIFWPTVFLSTRF